MNDDLDLSRHQYAEPGMRDLLEELPLLTVQLNTALDALQSDPNATRCSALVITLYVAQTLMQRLRTAVERST